MNNIRNSLIGICIAVAAPEVLAQGTGEYGDHHPADVAAPAAPAKKSPGKPMGADRMGAMDRHMKAMQAMHEKMVAAKTPAERQALMADHMKLMQEGMGMMMQMRGMAGMGGMPGGKAMSGNMADRQQMMEKRMDMMESMMQMMMDRMPPAPAK